MTSDTSGTVSGPDHRERTQSIFISSTFLDMQSERDFLRDIVFPALAENVRPYGRYLEFVDLRWGVETTGIDEVQHKELLVLKVCLGEVERCKPFLIALIGDRYGWVPPAEGARSAAAEAGFAGSIEGKSVTALEIEFGALARQEQTSRSYFYFRDPLPYDSMPPEIAARYSEAYSGTPNAHESARKLEVLKEQIARKVGPDHVRRYRAEWDGARHKVAGLEKFGALVAQDLLRELTAGAEAIRTNRPWQEDELDGQERLFDDACRSFQGRVSLRQEIHALLGAEQPPFPQGLCLTGPPGIGKTALLAMIARELDPGAVVIAYSAGASPRAPSLDAFLRCCLYRLNRDFGVPDNSADAADLKDLQDQFWKALAGLSGRRIYLIVDALNQFERTAACRMLTWIPQTLPPGMRLVVSATPETEEVRHLSSRRDFRVMPVAALTVDDARDILRAECEAWHKTLSPEVVDLLCTRVDESGTPASGNPLWLKIAVQCLLLLDQDDFSKASAFAGTPEQQLRQLLMDVAAAFPARVEELCRFLFARAEKLFGETWVRSILALLAQSRAGLRESDLAAIVPKVTGGVWEPLQFARFRRYFRAQIALRGQGGAWDAVHQQLKKAAAEQSASWGWTESQIHTLIASRLTQCPPGDPVRQREAMFHLLAAGLHENAARYYGSDLASEESALASEAVAEYLKQSEEGAHPEAAVQWLLNMVSVPGLDYNAGGRITQHFNFDLFNLLATRISVSTRLRFFQGVCDLCEWLCYRAPGSELIARNYSLAHSRLGEIGMGLQRWNEARDHFLESHRILEEIMKVIPDPSYRHSLVSSMHRLAAVYSGLGETERAGEWLDRANRIVEGTKEDAQSVSDAAIQEANLGNLAVNRGDWKAACEHFERAVGMLEDNPEAASGPEDHLSGLYHNLAIACFNTERSGNGLEYARRAVARREERFRRAPGAPENLLGLAGSYEILGSGLARQGQSREAIDALEKAADMYGRVGNVDSRTAARQQSVLKQLSQLQGGEGRPTEAAGSADGAVNLAEKAWRAEPTNSQKAAMLANAWLGLARILKTRGDETALHELAGRVVPQMKNMPDPPLDSPPRQIASWFETCGDLLSELGDYEEALLSYRKALTVYGDWRNKQPNEAEPLKGAALLHHRMSLLFQAAVDFEGVCEQWDLCRAAFEEMEKRGMPIEPDVVRLRDWLRARSLF